VSAWRAARVSTIAATPAAIVEYATLARPRNANAQQEPDEPKKI
jgi:hypothetical protein